MINPDDALFAFTSKIVKECTLGVKDHLERYIQESPTLEIAVNRFKLFLDAAINMPEEDSIAELKKGANLEAGEPAVS